MCTECGKATEGPCPGCGVTMCFECVLRHSLCAECRKQAMDWYEMLDAFRRIGFSIAYGNKVLILRHWTYRTDGSDVVKVPYHRLAFRARALIKELREQYPLPPG